MTHQESPSYPIDPPAEPSREFLHARSIAGGVLQGQFDANHGSADPSRDYKWIKTELTWPSFDHLTFAFGNRVFSILVDLQEGDGGRSQLSHRERERCTAAAAEHKLVPCLFPVDRRTMRPLNSGWNLFHLVDRSPVVPGRLATDDRIPMSEWEVRNFAIQIVRNHLKENESAKVLSYCDIIGIDPQIWFEDRDGGRHWVIVRHYGSLHGEEWRDFTGFVNSNPGIRPFDGHFAAVSLASSEPVLYDLDGNIIPLSKRFDGTAPLYRGDGFYVNFGGLKRIHVS